MASATAGKVRPTGAEPAMICLLGDEAWQVQVKAVQALGRLAAKSAIEQLGRALSSPVSNVRKEVAAALGEIADPTALRWLDLALADPDPDVRNGWAVERCS